MSTKRDSGGYSLDETDGTRRTRDDWSAYEWPRRRARDVARKRYWTEHDRESHACADCGRTDVALEVHHMDENPYNPALDNLVARCHWCHRQLHRRVRIAGRLVEMQAEFQTFGEE